MTRFSANLGFLWTDRPLPDAIRAAKAAGFDAVECHWPYDTPAADVRAALDETGLPLLGLNTRRGDVGAGENGLSALPGREDEARAAIVEAIKYGVEIGAGAVHVMAGMAEGADADQAFQQNLSFAADLADKNGMTVLIEPLNAFDAPGYFLANAAQAVEIIGRLDKLNVKLMFDCYHVGRTEGDVIATLRHVWAAVGHVQFASVPDRGAPDHGDVDYGPVFEALDQLGWATPLGAEYKPGGDTDATMGWLKTFR